VKSKENSKKELEELLRNVMSTRAAPAAAPVQPVAPMMPMGMPSFASAQPRQFQYQQRPEQRCFYCKQTGHMVAECLVRQQDLSAGRVSITEAGRLQLPDGSPIPWDPSRAIKERVDEWHKKNGQPAQQAYMAPAQPAYMMQQPNMVYAQVYQPASSLDETYEEQIRALQQELDQKRAFLKGRPAVKAPEEVIEEQRQVIAALQAERDNALSQGFD
jgi:hypothetical protein